MSIKNNGCMQVLPGGHKPERVLNHKLEKKDGSVKDSWYLFIEDKDIPEEKIVTCEMEAGSVLFLHQLVPHRSLENFSEDVDRISDLRFQNPLDEVGFHTGLVDPIIMRKSSDPQYKPDWDAWFKDSKEQHTKFGRYLQKMNLTLRLMELGWNVGIDSFIFPVFIRFSISLTEVSLLL